MRSIATVGIVAVLIFIAANHAVADVSTKASVSAQYAPLTLTCENPRSPQTDAKKPMLRNTAKLGPFRWRQNCLEV